MITVMNFILAVIYIWAFVFVSNRKHLLSLEFIVLSLFLFLFLIMSFFSAEMFFSMLFFTFSVCEGALGISILVSMFLNVTQS